ncbi:ABC transporter ATP-binding protein [Clostridium cadaveris]|uniref:ATP-binding cassette, subfamily B n=1 Tax=Clostridium cadaveris TaxID=1529 RepID=A0A1I2NE44_9CLOT|nr:ABC transporter ATP-binding protein [Clostridium cadaveris]MDM8311982.1 ABC transporter ATP-binding protein [Clostridium cadaveris]NME62986.1 ABC transporter ATP-binding protein [Clostridium cadaveris]SFG02195.1 ATP-binding cassette, subfamily B [Clostridium cadaveris]
MARNSTNQDEKLEFHSRRYILKKLASYLKPFKGKVAIVILLMIFVTACGLINPYLLKMALDDFVPNSNIGGLVVIALGLMVVNLISLFAARIRIIMMSQVTNSILITIRHDLYSHIQKLSFSFFDNRPVGKVLARVMGDVNALKSLFATSITSFIPQLLSLVFVTIIMFSLNFNLAVAAMIILPVLGLGLFSIEAKSRSRWLSYRQKRSNVNAYTHEDFSGIKVVQGFAEEKKSESRFHNMVSEMMDSFNSAVKLNDLFWPLVELSWGVGTILVYWLGAKLIVSSDISIGTLVAFSMYITMFWRPIMNISDFYNTLITNFAAAERIFEIMSVEPDIVSSDGASEMPKIKGTVEFKEVSFAYDDDDVTVLKNVSFKVNPGDSIALVGATGAGKTTIINLLSRFYDVTDGSVLIDGIDVRSVTLESLRGQMGIMLQDTFLFSDTIKENIRYGRLDATDDEVIAAAKAVNAHDFIMKLEDGYETEVNERGSRLSVGQRQLISFARALLANPRILILDEATSNIDTYTEMLVQNGINKLLKGRTSFVIAHRLSTIRDCDKIMVIDDGRIVEAGTHDELLKLKGYYYNLYMAQYRFLKEGA